MTQTEINEFLKESNAIEREYSDVAFEDARLAWDYADTFKDDITPQRILSIHRLLMYRLNPEIAGKIRECDVWIGGEKRTFYGISSIEKELQGIVYSMNLKQPECSENYFCKATHIRFELIHPFVDGNGRVGRILYNIHRIKLGLPIHIIREKEKHKYYEWFKKEATDGTD